jgi:hypothetical protein
MFPIHLWLFCSWFCILDGHLVIMSCCFLSCMSHAAVCTVFFIHVLNTNFISDCNLNTEILHSIMTELTLDVE